MKTLLLCLPFACSLVMVHAAQFARSAPEARQKENKPTIVERDANHRVWQRVSLETNKVGKVRSRTNSYVELGSGMHFKNKEGNWEESESRIEITPRGASASKGPHKVNFAPNLNTVGAIDFTTPDGKQLRSHVLGLSYFDASTGESALIAEIKDSIGELLAPNQVVYPDAFSGVKADVRYTYTKHSFEQDIILREKLLSPAEYGLNPDTTRLEVLTEFINPPVPVKTAKQLENKAVDEVLDFGAMRIGTGSAFSLGETNGPAQKGNRDNSARRTRVQKTWARMEGRDFLIESLQFPSVEPHLQELPQPKAQTANWQPVKKASLTRKLPPQREARVRNEKIEMASLGNNAKGFVIDYLITLNGSSSLTNYTFQGDTTYYVTGLTYLYGTTVFEGGTVIKFAPQSGNYFFAVDGLFDCRTDSYRPAVFTSANDDSVGEIISGSTGNPAPYEYEACFAFDGGVSILNNVRFSYTSWACSFWWGSSGGEIRNAQFVKCAVPINTEGSTIRLQNVLINKCHVPLRGNGAYTITAENVTIDDVFYYLSGPGSGFIYFTNSIAISLTDLGDATIVTNNSVVNTSSVPGVFQTVGAASYYLATNSIYRNIGTTNINTNLLADLREKTTYPPIVISSQYYTNDLVLSPQAQRDTDVIDLGYHYDALDYALGHLFFTNSVVTINPGTAIATFSSGGGYGFIIGQGAELTSTGEPHNLNYIVNYNTVQEQSNTNWVSGYPISINSSWDFSPPAAQARFRFTAWSMLAGYTGHFYSGDMQSIVFQDCQFFNGYIQAIGPSTYLTNNLLHRVLTYIDSAPSANLQNNTFFGGVFEFYNWDEYLWTFYNNLFAHTAIYQGHDAINNYNAFFDTPYTLTPVGASNVTVTNLTFQSGPLGDFYLATNNVRLLNTGSTNANLLTFYHYTTATNQVKETNSIVDRGFHYVAVNGDGEPIDTDDDGNPDYKEDSNGDGDLDSGETSVTNAPDLGLRVFITRPKSNSVIP